MSLLENYYDRNRADRFESLFAGTDIGRRPTPNRHRYVILRFDFSAFDDTPETLRERFETYCHTRFRAALERNPDLFPDHARQRILSPPTIDGKLNELFVHAADHDIPLCVLIDEYDNFANTILAYQGEEAYQSFTHGGGFYRNFFTTLKAGAGYGRGVERLFITGVSPITMDDVTSGFNIGTNISLHPQVQRDDGQVVQRLSLSPGPRPTTRTTPCTTSAACLHEMAYRGAWRPVLEFPGGGHRPAEQHPRLHRRRRQYRRHAAAGRVRRYIPQTVTGAPAPDGGRPEDLLGPGGDLARGRTRPGGPPPPHGGPCSRGSAPLPRRWSAPGPCAAPCNPPRSGARAHPAATRSAGRCARAPARTPARCVRRR